MRIAQKSLSGPYFKLPFTKWRKFHAAFQLKTPACRKGQPISNQECPRRWRCCPMSAELYNSRAPTSLGCADSCCCFLSLFPEASRFGFGRFAEFELFAVVRRLTPMLSLHIRGRIE